MRRIEPDFEIFEKVLKGEAEPGRVHFAELLVDEEVIRDILVNRMGISWIPLTEETRKSYWQQMLGFYRDFGYDFFPIRHTWLNMPEIVERTTADSAKKSRGERVWSEEGRGRIQSWQDFEEFPWDEIKPDLSAFESVESHLPDGMKVTITGSLFEMVMEKFLGFEGLFFLLNDDPELVEAVFNRWGEIVRDFYAQLVDHPNLGAIWHADDMGHKTGTLISPVHLRTLVFPWFKQYAAMAHKCGKTIWLHSCGDLSRVIDDLIDDVGFDALHSYEDVIMPVTDSKKAYGHRVGLLGGVDVDKLCRLDEDELRKYVNDILDTCMSGGRFALGSGNSVANYVPVQNYLTMLDVGRRWKP